MIKLVYSENRWDFVKTCKELGINPQKTKYVAWSEGVTGLTTAAIGLYAEAIYPPWAARLAGRPSKPKTEEIGDEKEKE